MRTISEILTLLGILILFGSCKKDIEIDYHTVAPLYVIEASVTNDGMKARVSRTNAMDDNTTTARANNSSTRARASISRPP